MVSQLRIARPKRRSRQLKQRAQTPRLEAFEPRLLLASNAFLQGVVTVSGTSLPQAGATVLLHSLDSPPSIADQSTTTGSDGVYQFQNLPSGKYQLTETPPSRIRERQCPHPGQVPAHAAHACIEQHDRCAAQRSFRIAALVSDEQ